MGPLLCLLFFAFTAIAQQPPQLPAPPPKINDLKPEDPKPNEPKPNEPKQEDPKPPEGPIFYKSATGPISLPNKCSDLDLGAIGLTCSLDDPCATFLEISSLDRVGDAIIVAGNTHTSTNTLDSILLLSEDLGATWREAHPRLKTSTLESLQFLDFANGWLAGHSSLALPRDPFILLTTDGGRSWRKTDIFLESRVGVIEDFAFQTARNGWLLVDNRGSNDAGKYELYSTQTGGTSWELREISSRVPRTVTAQPRTHSSSARTRVDEKKGLLHVEIRAGNAWRSVATFRVRLDDCKPAPQP